MAVMLKKFAWNAGANVFSGAMAAAYQLTITFMAIKAWHGTEFSSWALALSVAAIMPIFAINLSSLVARRVVEGLHSKSEVIEPAVLLSGRRIGHQLTFIAFVSLICAGTFLHMHSTTEVMSTAGFFWMLLLLLLTNTWVLLWQVRFGRYYADECYWPPALMFGAARMGGEIGMIIALALSNQSLAAAACGLCVGTWMGLGCAQVLLPSPSIVRIVGAGPSRTEIQKQYRKNTLMLSGFAVGSVSMIVIQYGIPPFMAILTAQRFNAFYLASVFNTIVIGVLAAAMAPMLAPLTRWHIRGEVSSLRSIILFSPILCASISFLALCFCWYAMDPILHAVTVRTASVEEIRIFLALLGFQTIIRNAAAGFAMYVSSAGSPREMAAPIIIEIALAVIVAVPVGLLYGALPLLYGLIFAGALGSLYSSRIVASLHQPQQISLRTSFSSLLIAQTTICGVWWWIVRSSL